MELNFNYSGDQYGVDVCDDSLVLKKNEVVKTVKVIKDYEYEHVYKITRKNVLAIGGAKGLFEHFKKCVENDFAVECWVVAPIDNMLRKIK